MKLHLKDLALFGGKAEFDQPLYIGRPNVGSLDHLSSYLKDIFDRRWFTNHGPLVGELERRIAVLLGVKHCILVCNGTMGLEILAKALGLEGEVILPSFTFIATAHALQWLGITPVFCDVDPQTHNIDPYEAEKLITPRTTAIVGVHLWGRPCNLKALEEIADANNLRLIFDAAHAFGCSHRGTMIGNFGDAEVFSFHATKFFNTFEGGGILTNDDDLAERLRLMRNFGFADYDTVVCVGINGKMTEIAAAMGLTMLDSLADFITINRRNYNQYLKHLCVIPGISMVTYDESESCNYQYCVIEVDEAVTQIGRDQLQKILWAENVIARRYFYPGCHRSEPYISSPLYANRPLNNTDQLANRVLCLPSGTSVGPDEIDSICQIIKLVITHGLAIKEELECQIKV